MLEEVHHGVSDVRHVVPGGVVEAPAVAVAVHGVDVEVPGQLRHHAEEAAAVHPLGVEQHQGLPVVWDLVVLKTCVPALVVVLLRLHRATSFRERGA